MNGNHDHDDWPAWNDETGWTRVDARTYLAAWVEDLRRQSDEFQFAIDALPANCDRLKLAWLLSALSNAILWQNMSREDVREIAEGLQRAAKVVRRLFFSQLHPFFPGLDTLRLADELSELARRSNAFVPVTDQRRSMTRDLVTATLTSYVQRTSGHFHDDEVAALISVIEMLDHRQNYDGLVIGVAPVRQEPYTTEAHVRWRNRPPCQDLLNGPSQAVRELEAAMNRDLREVDGQGAPLAFRRVEARRSPRLPDA